MARYDHPIELRPSTRELERALASMMRWGRDLTPLMRELRKPVLHDQADHRKRTAGPDGKWAPRSPFTRARAAARTKSGRKRGRGRLLGKLPGALNVSIERRRLLVISRVKWSGVHQDGAGKTGHAPSIPARTFLWISGKALRQIERTVIDMATKEWK